jgi:outer membrane receptor protein involved in Fe transport
MKSFYLILFIPLCLLLSLNTSYAQVGIIQGIVRDAQTKEALEGVIVSATPSNRVVTASGGAYKLTVPAGGVQLVFNYVGYAPDTTTLVLQDGQTKKLNVQLGYTDNELNTIVVSTSKFGKKIQKETVSMEVLKPRFIETNGLNNAKDAIARVPGVTIMDGSISIRGGSGYAYGSGSRVIMVVDEMPLLTPDRGEIRWELVPLENMSQMEVIKSSSSVQYGAGAMNGVIHLRTAYPTDTPETRIQLYTEITDIDNRVLKKGWQNNNSYAWWKKSKTRYFNAPHTNGVSFLHKHKYKDFDFVISGNLHEQQSHLSQEYEQHTRFTTKVKYTPHKYNGRLSFGLNSTLMYRKNGFQFWWQGQDNPLISADGVDIDEHYFYAFIDPSITFIDKRHNQHRFLGRWFYFNKTQSTTGPTAQFGTFDYQFRHDFGNIVKFILGFNNQHFNNMDRGIGSNSGDYGGIYASADINVKKLTISAGIRAEYLRINDKFGFAMVKFQDISKKGDTSNVRLPVFRFGLNYQIRKYNYLRMSVGLAYRFPSLAEKFATAELGALEIIPNNNIQPESGFSFELGYKRSFNIGNSWRGYFDAATFLNEFSQMMEFQITDIKFVSDVDEQGNSTNKLVGIFQSQNITRARVFGWEFGLVGEGKIGHVDLALQAGYTYAFPLNLEADSAKKDLGYTIKKAFTTYGKLGAADAELILKYRNRHVFKADIDALFYKRVRFGTSLQYYSYMDNIDPIFLIAIPDLKEYRNAHVNKGDFVWDVRLGYDVNRHFSFNFMAKNILNTFYMLRPGRPSAPRTFGLQCNIKL